MGTGHNNVVNVEAFVEGVLGSAQEELAKKEAINRSEDEAWAAAQEKMRFLRGPDPERIARNTRITELKAQVQLLEQIKEMMNKQHTETTEMLGKQWSRTKAHFMAIKKRDDQSSRLGVWLTIVSSAVSLILGWLLSLVGSPASVLHALGH